MPYDIDELGAQLSAFMQKQAGQRMPAISRLKVVDATQQEESGYVMCDNNGAIVRCWVGHNWDLRNTVAGSSEGQHIIYALPETGIDGRGEFVAVSYGYNGLDGSRIPRIFAPNYDFTDDSGGTFFGGGARGDILIRNATTWATENIAEQRIVGRITGGDVTDLTAAQVKTLLAIDHGADLTGLGDDDHAQYILLTPTTDTRNVIQPSTSTVKALTLKAATSQSDSLLEFQNSSGTLLSSFNQGGALSFAAANTDPVGCGVYRVTSGTTGLYLSNKSAPSGQVVIETGSTGTLLWIFAKSGLSVGSPSGNAFVAVRTTNPASLFAAVRGEVSSGSSSGFVYGVAGFVTGAGATDKAAFHAEVESGAAGTNTYGLFVADIGGGTNKFAILTNAGNVVLNEGGDASTDFRVESDSDANQIFLDASANALGVGTGSPTAKLHISQPTLGSEVFRLESVASNDDPSERIFQNKVTTTNNTQTTLHTFTLAASTTYLIETVIVARRTGGTAGSAEDGAGYKIVGTYKNVAGTATLIGALSVVHSAEDQAGWDATLTVTGATVLARVTGATDNNISWAMTARAYPIGT